MRFFVDSSALVKLYFREAGTERMRKLARDHSKRSFELLDISKVECASAVERLARDGKLDRSQADSILGRLHRDFRQFQVRPVTMPVVDLAVELLQKHPLKAYDAIQLAGCRETAANPPVFVCADRRLRDAAKAEGLKILDPEA